MSRIGRKVIETPGDVTVTVQAEAVSVKGKNGTLTCRLRPEIAVKVDAAAKQVVVEDKTGGQASAYHGMTRALIQNMILGVTTGFRRDLEINGIGWTAQVKGRVLELKIGYADVRKQAIPTGVNVNINNQRIEISGADKQAVGQFAALVRMQRKPEPYNGKGIKYVEEVIIRKAGKAFAGGGAG